MSEQPGAKEPVEPSTDDTTTSQTGTSQTGTSQEGYGSLSVEDDPGGTVDPADLAGTAKPDDEPVGYQPSASEASGGSGESDSGTS
jgi:hypothetical protein